jgi:hypothetical protein
MVGWFGCRDRKGAVKLPNRSLTVAMREHHSIFEEKSSPRVPPRLLRESCHRSATYAL